MSSNKSKKQLFKNFFSLTLVQIANYVLPLISVPVISRIIGPDKYGVINFALAFVAYFNLLISYGFDLTATRKIAKDPQNQDVRNIVVSEVFFTQCILFIISVAIFSLLLYNIPQLSIEKAVMVFTFLFCFSTLLTQNWLFQAMQDLSKVAILNLFGKVLFTIVVLIAVRKKEDYILQPLLFNLVQILIAASSFIWAWKKYKIKFIRVPFQRCFSLLWEEKTVFFSLVVVTLYTTTNTFILGLYQNSEQVGYYTAGQRLIIIAQSVLTIPLSQALYPFIGKAFGESRQRGLRVAQQVIPIIIILSGTISIVMFASAPLVINIFYGQKFLPSIPVFQMLTFIPLLVALSNVFGIQIMLNLGMDNLFFKITALGALLSILLNFLMIRQLGYVGTTLNWLITEICILISMYLGLKSKGISPINFHDFHLSEIKKFYWAIKREIFFKKKK